jgi:hypothetical protein
VGQWTGQEAQDGHFDDLGGQSCARQNNLQQDSDENKDYNCNNGGGGETIKKKG